MTPRTPDDLRRDFPKTATEFEAVRSRGGLPVLLDQGALGRRAGLRAV